MSATKDPTVGDAGGTEPVARRTIVPVKGPCTGFTQASVIDEVEVAVAVNDRTSFTAAVVTVTVAAGA